MKSPCVPCPCYFKLATCYCILSPQPLPPGHLGRHLLLKGHGTIAKPLLIDLIHKRAHRFGGIVTIPAQYPLIRVAPGGYKHIHRLPAPLRAAGEHDHAGFIGLHPLREMTPRLRPAAEKHAAWIFRPSFMYGATMPVAVDAGVAEINIM